MGDMVNKSFTNLSMVLVMVAAVALWPQQDRFATGLFRGMPSVGTEKLSALPVILSTRDTALYKEIFAAQKDGKWTDADDSLADVKSTVLIGHVLAERYLDTRYKAKPEELTEWLANYSDHPEAYAIYNMALAKSPASKNTLENIVKPKQLAADYGTNLGSDVSFARTPQWQGGLDAWRKGNTAAAAKSFVKLAENNKLSIWQRSAANYWAWRALDASGQDNAKTYLRRAAEDGRSFYSVLARRQLGDAVVSSDKVGLSDSEVLEMIQEPAVRRVIALTQIGKNEIAERELRVAFPQQADIDGKLRLLALAHDLNLASIQINMANHLDKDGATLDFAHYPVPHWQPQDGFKVDPALIYAVARQESGFRIAAVSPDGAQGLMQLMPKTALMMKKNLSLVADANASEPAINMMLGQNYVRHLLDHKMVDGNLIYMLTAYNAGAGRLEDWKKSLPQNDPLLFVESIPFGETRAYVMQVMTNYWIYSELAGNNNSTITALAKGQWPSYDTTTPVAQIRTADING